MKKLIIVLGIVTGSTIAALSLNKKAEVKPVHKINKMEFSGKGYDSNFKADLSNAD